ncbi:MAG: ATP synthase F1 subunit delta [Chloroflexota bacterium]
MARRTSAKRYAKAIFEIALERQELDKWQSDLNKLAILSMDADLLALFENPKLRFEDKASILSGQFKDINPLALNMVNILVARDMLNIVGEISEEYQHLLDSYHNIEPAEVVTAVPLDDAEKAKLSTRLEAIIGKKIAIKAEVDSSLLGGIIVRAGGKLLDGSTRHRLQALKEELVK